jgi:SGNH domain (fused to AT3 domains)
MSRAIAATPCVFIGKISYSLYLWHFPLLAFGAYLSIDELSAPETTALVLASVLFACLSWKFVEQPARRRGGPQGQRRVLALGLLVTVAFWAAGYAIDHGKGFPARMTAEQLEILKGSQDHDAARTACFVNERNARRRVAARCAFYRSDTPAQFVLWGDSHGEAMRPAFRVLAQRYKVAGTFMGDSGCPPVIGVERSGKPGCATSSKEILQWVLDNPSVRTVVLAARWAYWTRGDGFKIEQVEPITLSLQNGGGRRLDTAQVLGGGLETTVATLLAAHREVWIVGPTPEVGFDVPMSRYRHELGIDRDVNIDPLRSEYAARQEPVFQLFKAIGTRFPSVRFVWPHQALCDPNRCRTVQDGRALYYDDDHLSVYGAELIAPTFIPVFEALARATPAAPFGSDSTAGLDTEASINLQQLSDGSAQGK